MNQDALEVMKKQLHQNDLTIKFLLEKLALSWDNSLDDNPIANQMRGITLDYMYSVEDGEYKP